MAIQNIVCCTDFSENAKIAFDTALEMAEKYAAKLTVLHVIPPIVNPHFGSSEWMIHEEARKSLFQQLEEQMQEEYGSKMSIGVDTELVVLEGHVSTEIIKYLEKIKADIALMGAYGLSGMGLVLFGSIAKRLVHRAPCSVMIVR
jgi:universal stress protein A